MRIVQIATECAPIAKVGGLADVVYGLSRALRKQGHHVEVLLPKYDCINYSELTELKVHKRQIWSFENNHRYNNTIWSAKIHDLPLFLLETHHPLFYFTRSMIYGCPDDNDRFLYFCRASMEYLLQSGEEIDIIHTHDWPTAAISILHKKMYKALNMKAKSTVLTIHNLEHQGRISPSNLTKIGLRGETFLNEDEMQDPLIAGNLNLMKGGIKYADAITTVSPTYKKEIETSEGGRGLDSFIKKYTGKITGILNGLDEDFWNPSQDRYLIKRYPEKCTPLSKVFEAKKENREYLTQHLLLEKKNTPLVASIGRLVMQKAPHLILHALHRTLELGGQFILLGTPMDAESKALVEKARKEITGNKNALLHLQYDEALSHQLFAAADLFIIPSLFEPCGLTQMIALKYGAIPIARQTGGLSDTVFDIEQDEIPFARRNGFTFEFPDSQGVTWALNRAFDYLQNRPKAREDLVRSALHSNFSWEKAAGEYAKIYQSIG